MRIVLIILLGGLLLFGLLLALEPAWQGWPGALLIMAVLLAPAAWVVQGLVRAHWRAARAQDKAPAWVYFLQLHCPRCGQQAMPLVRKWRLGWSKVGNCCHCGQHVQNDAPALAMLAGPPLMGLLLGALTLSLVRQLTPVVAVAGFGLLGVLVSVALALWRPFLKLDTGAALHQGSGTVGPSDAQRGDR